MHFLAVDNVFLKCSLSVKIINATSRKKFPVIVKSLKKDGTGSQVSKVSCEDIKIPPFGSGFSSLVRPLIRFLNGSLMLENKKDGSDNSLFFWWLLGVNNGRKATQQRVINDVNQISYEVV